MENGNSTKIQNKVTFKDMKEGVKDEFGVYYSADGKRMLG